MPRGSRCCLGWSCRLAMRGEVRLDSLCREADLNRSQELPPYVS